MITKAPPLSEELILEGRRNPGGWVYQIDWNYRADQAIPPNSIVGAWKVSESGAITDSFEENENYSPIIHSKRRPRQYIVDYVSISNMFDDWIEEIDPSWDQNWLSVPAEKVLGVWYVDKDGQLTDIFRPNVKYDGEINII